MNTQVKHNCHHFLSEHSIHNESDGQPSEKKLILSSKFSARKIKTIRA